MSSFQILARAGVVCSVLFGAQLSLAALIPTITCQSTLNLFNTAYNATTGGRLTSGVDERWQIGAGTSAGPSSVSSWSDAPVYYFGGPWVTSPYGNANWVGGGGGFGAPYYYYRFQFNLGPSVPPSAISLPFIISSDDWLAQIFVNGVAQGAHGVGFDGFANNTLSHDFQAGLNTVIFQVYNETAPTGFLAQMRPTDVICPKGVIAVTKTTSATNVVPNGTVTYDMTVKNTGTVTATGVSVVDTLPAGAFSSTSWTCSASGGASCPASSGTGTLNQTGVTLPGGGVLTYTLTGTVVSVPPAQFTNTLQVTPGSGVCQSGAASCEASATLPPVGIVDITKTSGVSSAYIGDTIPYIVTVTNPGQVAATNVVVDDPLPSGIASGTWSCAGTCGAASGSLPLHDQIPSLAGGSSATYTIQATLATSGLPATITNVATATPPSPQVCVGGVTPPCKASVSIAGINEIDPPAITKLGTLTNLTTNEISWTITATNTQATAQDLVITDPVPSPATFVSGSMLCASGGSLGQCAFDNPSAPTQLIASASAVPPGGFLKVTVKTVVAPGVTNSVTNTAKAQFVSSSGAQLSAAVTATSVVGALRDIPALSAWMLGLLALTLVGIAKGYRVQQGIHRM